MRPGCLSVAQSVSQSVGMSVQGLSSIAPDRRSRSGRDRHQKMRQSSGTTMVVVTWRHVSRVTRHVPPRKKYAKKVYHACSPNGGWPGAQTFRPEGPWSDLSAMGSNRPGGAMEISSGQGGFLQLGGRLFVGGWVGLSKDFRE